MTFEQKLTSLTAAITQQAAALGLIFVKGPDTGIVPPPVPSTNPTSGQMRGVYLFGVADA